MHWQLRRGRVLQRRALRGRGQLGSSGCTGRHALRGGRSRLRAPARMRSPLEILGPPTPGRVLCPAIPRLRPHVPPRPRGLCSTGCPRPGRALDAPPSATASGSALPFDVLRVGGVRMRPAILLKPPGGEPVDRLDHATGSRLHSRVLLQLGHGDARGPNDLHRTPRGALATPAGGTRRAQRVGHGARGLLGRGDDPLRPRLLRPPRARERSQAPHAERHRPIPRAPRHLPVHCLGAARRGRGRHGGGSVARGGGASGGRSRPRCFC